MATPITVNYTQDGADWRIAVARGTETLAERAPGLIAARDKADQLVEQLTEGADATVVHLLDGDAVAFSTAYLHARHGGPAGAPAEDVPRADENKPEQDSEAPDRETEPGDEDQAEDTEPAGDTQAVGGTPVIEDSQGAEDDQGAEDTEAQASGVEQAPDRTEALSS